MEEAVDTCLGTESSSGHKTDSKMQNTQRPERSRKAEGMAECPALGRLRVAPGAEGEGEGHT